MRNCSLRVVSAFLIFGLAFYIIPMWIILFGAFVAAQPFSKEFNFVGAGDIRTTPILVITSKAGQLIGGILLISIVWVIVFTLLDLIGLEGVETNISGFINHDSSNSFFVGQ